MRMIPLSKDGEQSSSLPGAAPSKGNTEASDVHEGTPPLLLVIDDSPTVRKVLESCLSRAGFLVRGFRDGIAAMRWLCSSEGRVPALIILDVGLPKLDGYQVTRRFKAAPLFSDVVVIMLSGRDGIGDQQRGFLAGAREYLIKPVDPQELLRVIETHVGLPMSTEIAMQDQ